MARDRHRPAGSAAPDNGRLRKLIKANRLDVIIALLIAGTVNIGMLLLAAATLRGAEGTDSIEGAHQAITSALGPAVGIVFGVGLLASGLASTSVGCYAGATIMSGLLSIRVPLLLRRVISLIPAILLLSFGVDPTWALVVSQVVLSFGIPFALIPLLRMTFSAEIMGEHRDGLPLRVLSVISAALIVLLNVALIVLTVTGAG